MCNKITFSFRIDLLWVIVVGLVDIKEIPGLNFIINFGK